MHTCLPIFLQNERFQIYAKAKNVLYAPVSAHPLRRSVLSSAELKAGRSSHMCGYLSGSYIDIGNVGQWG